MFLANDITKPWVVCLKGDPVEVTSARDKSAIIIKCNGERLTVSSFDITDINPIPLKKYIPATKTIPLYNSKTKKSKKI